ncbi:hypothetical protein MMC30_001126 [Trapelia coarctata]|nr:hypothetical protein [Trapelia coarctata]
MANSSSLSPVLITGGCGFIGRHLVQTLLKSDLNCKVHVLDIDTERNRFDSATYHTCDIASAAAVEKVMQVVKPRVIFHLACPDSMILQPQLFQSVNVDGTRNLLSSAANVGTVQALVYTSTSSVIHDNITDMVDADETWPVLRPPVQSRVYTLTKATAEEEILAENRKGGNRSMLTVSLRPATAFGENDTVCLGKMFAVADQGKTKFQMGNGQNLYDFVYIDNLIDAHILAAEALIRAYGHPPPPADERVDGENFHVTNDEHILFWEFSRKIAAAAGHPVMPKDIVVIPAYLGLIMGWISEWIVWITSRGSRQPNMTREGIRFSTITRTLNGDKAKRVLGYRPRVTMDEGIERGVKWFVDNRPKEK